MAEVHHVQDLIPAGGAPRVAAYAGRMPLVSLSSSSC